MMLIGNGSPNAFIEDEQIYQILEEACSNWDISNQRILFIIPDNTRSGPIPLLFKSLCQILRGKVKQLDFLIALGTHPPMSENAIQKLVGITDEERNGTYKNIGIFNHQWKQADELLLLGKLNDEQTAELSKGMLALEVPVKVNRRVLDYDLLVICGPVFPHEVVGFSGGYKYFFPGISSQEMIDYTHWLGALLTSYDVIGKKQTPVRAMINLGATLLPRPSKCISFVVGSHGMHGLFAGEPEEAWSAAADLSAEVHIRYLARPVERVLAVLPEMYDELWVGGKGMYKTESVVADGGEIIIYAPHVHEVSRTHGAIIDKIGYHVKDYFIKQWDQFQHYPWGVLAHSTHVRGRGTFENGIEIPRINVTIASSIPREKIEKINLHYQDPQSIDIEQLSKSADDSFLFVPHAGEILFKLNRS